MDNNFQTSFIPKKSLTVERTSASPRMSFATFIAVLVFVISAAAFGGMYFYKATLVKSVASKNASLEAARNQFEPSLIAELQRLNRRIDDSNKLLASHISISPIFATLQASTLKSVQFTHFSYSLPSAAADSISIHMSGKARDYTAIALESDEVAKNKDIHNPIFSNLTLDEHTGIVTFELTFSISPSLVQYASHIPGVTDTTNGDTTESTTSSVPLTTPATPTTTPSTQGVSSTSPSSNTPLIHAGSQTP